ncbi:prolyl oligopeptidase family serine peptidase [Cytophagaceae bacterium DM2B3-1]|uniref:Acyl-peptide hydrolase n=1 Tax=Xanthocytophaga flava TaxID=3048013 RepID=A0ABT7CU86_9BACT|nr:prolyl oligopeptidase family serine peptidase [Xanthocytophaga flavus]MDJ1497329.1 prolyl oligopeptidase family serine peptidase [Xanthocytophaga flavus]
MKKHILLFFFCSITVFAQRPAFTLEQIMGTPFPTELTASPTDKKIAWVQNARGVRNIWMAQAPDFQGKQLTSFTKDDGKDISQLRWSPDARTLLFVYGGGTRGSEPPNPGSDPAGPELAIYKISTEGGQPVKITDGTYPTLSPKGDSLVFLRKGQIYITTLDGGKEVRQLLKVRGSSSQLRWSPNGNQLAFVSNRGDHSFIGVFDLTSRNLRFLSPSVDTDNNPVWSPDGNQIAFIRIPAGDDVIFGPTREAEPWSILVADVATGKGKTLWNADPGVGSAYREIVSDNQILWTANNYIVFPWEKDGWTHLYSVSAKGGNATLLTPGNFEVEYISLITDKNEILFNSNQDDIDRRHIWRVSPTSNKPVAVTQGKGIEWLPVMLSDGKTIGILGSDALRPARALMVTNTTSFKPLVSNILSVDFPEKLLVEPQAVTVSAVDGMPIPAQLFLPANIKKGEKRPALIFFHGGSRRQMLLGWNYGSYYHNAYALNQYFVSQGYIVLSVNYRSGIGYGMHFREAINYGEAGGTEFNDVMGAGLYLRSRPDVDGSKIGLWGGSYGGYLTAMGLSRASDLFAAGVDIHGVHDWNVGIKTFVPDYNKLEFPEKARKAFDASPLATVDTWKSPVLVIHGDDDRNVDFAETVELVKALRKRNVEIEQLIFPDEVHSFLRYANWLECFKATSDFFDRKLRNKNNP